MKLSGHKPFKIYYCLASFKLYRFYFQVDMIPANVRKPGSRKCGIAGLLSQIYQLIGSAEYSLLAVTGHDPVKFFDSVAFLFEKFVTLRDYTKSVYEIPASVLGTLFELVCIKTAVTDIYMTPGYIPGFINCIKILQQSRLEYKLSDQETLDDNQLNKVMRQARFESRILNKIRSELCLEYRDAFHKEGFASQDMFLAILRQCVQVILELDQQQSMVLSAEYSREAFAALERIFVLTAVTFLNLSYQGGRLVQIDIDQGRLELMNEQVFTSSEQKLKFYSLLARNQTRVAGFVRQANKSGIWVSCLVLT